MRVIPFEYSIRNLGRSPLRCALAIGGCALVILLVLTAAGFVRGMTHGLAISGSPDNVIILGAGSEESVERSEIDPATAGILAASVQGIRKRMGEPYVSEESHVSLNFRTARDGDTAYSTLFRGVTPAALLVHSQVRVLEGRLPQTARNELMVGRMSEAHLGLDQSSLGVGSDLWIDGRPWRIVGRFEAPGTVMESEIWCALSDLQIATKRSTFSCVVLTLDGGDFSDVDVFCKQRLDLQLVAMRESDYYAKLAAFFRPIRAMVWSTAIMIALGGLLGGLNTMYAAFAARVREFGALQTIGYSRTAIMLNMMQESLVMTCAGAIVAAALAVMILDGRAVRFSAGAFGLLIDAPALAIGIGTGLILGILGSLAPGYRALSQPISEALRAG